MDQLVNQKVKIQILVQIDIQKYFFHIERLEKSHAEEKERHSISFHYVLNRR